MPAVGEQALRFDALDDYVEIDVLIAAVGDLTPRTLAGSKRLALQVRAEPGAELLGVLERPPYALARSVDDDAALDAVGFLGNSAVRFAHRSWFHAASAVAGS